VQPKPKRRPEEDCPGAAVAVSDPITKPKTGGVKVTPISQEALAPNSTPVHPSDAMAYGESVATEVTRNGTPEKFQIVAVRAAEVVATGTQPKSRLPGSTLGSP
jgi:hypothetical protein